jgi:hypothetical protein
MYGVVASTAKLAYHIGIVYTTVSSSVRFGYHIYAARVFLMRSKLARYYRDKLVNTMRDFESPTINIIEAQVTGITWGPTKPKQTLYGSTITMQFTFKGGEDWED